MKFKLHPTVVCRTPRFPKGASLEACWNELKSAIASSSKDFYDQISGVTADEIPALPTRTQQTIQKYFNRARFRCVPYGEFASVGVFRLDGSGQEPIVLEDGLHVHSYTDWSAAAKASPEIDLDSQLLLANSSWYLIQAGMRYLSRGENGYQLTDNVQDELVLAILRLCEAPVSYLDLCSQLTRATADLELRELVEEMIALEMLFTSGHSYIIGEDYLQNRFAPAENSALPYQISVRNPTTGSLPPSVFRHIPELATRLHRIVAPYRSKALQAFIERFQQRFEGREIPLMQALDPEMGIGYAQLESSASQNDLVEALASLYQAGEGKELAVQHFFKQKLGKDRLSVIDLESLDLPEEAEHKPLPLPNTTALMCSVADDLVVVDMFGGATATALHGRFSLASDQIADHCRSMCCIEAEANPEVLFFDIGYQVGNRIDNVNRRRHLYDHSLSLASYDTSPEPLSLNDILVSVQGGLVLLRSKKYGKRLIPRLASAYNSGKSDLAVFRFLCDVQHQGIQSYLQLGLQGMFKGFKHYPRVIFRNIVVSPARWIFSRQELLKGKRRNLEHLRSMLEQAGVERYFKSGFSDQTLQYDLSSDEDLNLFLSEAEKQKDVEIEEVFTGRKEIVTDQQGQGYASQFVLNYFHREQIYPGIRTVDQNAPPISIKPPGSEWLYWEIYCHPQRTGFLLQDKIGPFIDKHRERISQWFFIRYQEHGPHLRLRLKLHRQQDLQPLLTGFASLLQPELESGIVHDLVNRCYKREVHRYGVDMMEAVETHFHLDSMAVLELLKTDPGPEALYRHCIRLIEKVAESGVFDPDHFESLLGRISGAFEKEHQLNPPAYKKMNQGFKNYLMVPERWTDEQSVRMAGLQHSLIRMLAAYPQNRRDAAFADLIHMHMNRLFASNQRSHELLVYYYCCKRLMAARKLNAAKLEFN